MQYKNLEPKIPCMTKKQKQILLLPGNCVYYWGKKKGEKANICTHKPHQERTFLV